MPPTTLFEDAVDVPIWLEADARNSQASRRGRDREIGRALAAADLATRVCLWWQRVDRGTAASPGEHLQRARRWLGFAAALLGIVGGVGLALAAFRYDGTYPVNVVRLLGLLVAPHLVLLALTLLLVPGRVAVLGPIQDALAAINPGALVGAVYRQLARSGAEAANLFGWAAARSAAAQRFAKWQVLHWSQVAAVAFNLAVVATAAALVAFTDLAFGWSTTLSVEPASAARIVAAIAAPWAALAPNAVPDATLVAQSQFFRLEGTSAFAAGAPRALAGWWSFTLLAVVVYGLLPRLAFLCFTAWRLRAATRRLLLDDARVTALLDRMAAPDVETQALDHLDRAEGAAAAPTLAHARLEGRASALVWGDCISAAAAKELARARLGLALDRVAATGGGHALADERAAIATVAAGAPTVVVFTPAWEPPVLEFMDLLAALRAALGPGASIIVTPLGEGQTRPTALERETWGRAVAAAADPRAYLETGEP